MPKVLFGFLRFLVLLYFMVAGLLYLMQDKLLYSPSDVVAHDYTEKLIESEGLNLKVVVLNEGKEKALLYFGGNSESVLSLAEKRAENFSDYTVYLVNYRGYGGNSGKPSKEALYADALVAYDTFKKEHTEIFLMGRSLGSGVASYVASQREVKKLVLITPFDTLVNVVQAKYPMYPIKWILKDKYDNVENLSKAKKTEVLVVIAKGDKVIPNENSMALIESLGKENVQVEVIKGQSHTSLSHAENYFARLNGFFK